MTKLKFCIFSVINSVDFNKGMLIKELFLIFGNIILNKIKCSYKPKEVKLLYRNFLEKASEVTKYIIMNINRIYSHNFQFSLDTSINYSTFNFLYSANGSLADFFGIQR